MYTYIFFVIFKNIDIIFYFQINLYYLGSDHEMTIVPEVPKFTYVYPAVDKGAWLNYTTVSVYASGTLIMRTEYVPDRDL